MQIILVFKIAKAGLLASLLAGLLFSGCKEQKQAQTVERKSGLEPLVPSVSTSPAIPQVPKAELFNLNAANNSEIVAQALAESQGDAAKATLYIEALRLPVAKTTVLLVELAKRLTAEKLDYLPELLSQVQHADAREMVLGVIASQWSQADPSTLVRFALEKLEGVDRNQALFVGMQGLFKRSQFAEAASYIEQMPFSQERTATIIEMANQYRAHNLDAALAWTQTLPLLEDQIAAAKQLIPQVSLQQGAAGLVELANRYPAPDLQQTCIQQAVLKLAESGNTDDAAAWITSLPSDLQDTAQIQLISALAEQNISAWTKYVLEQPSTHVQARGVSIIANRMFARGSDTALAWASQLPAWHRDVAIGQIAAVWFETDSIALSQWMNALPNGSTKDRVLETVARKLAITDHASAKEVALRISNPNRLQAVIRDLDSQLPR